MKVSDIGRPNASRWKYNAGEPPSREALPATQRRMCQPPVPWKSLTSQPAAAPSFGGVARTSTFALTNATLPFAVQIANKGAKAALLADPHLLNGLNVHAGKITYKAVADDLGYAYVSAADALNA